ncbi:MAG: hydroxypyruvate isomerase [Pseudomonadota bacterium]|jgi:hydroxypyruvate isomerase
MPKFAANLTMMFNEVPFLQRFDAAANAGFTACEFLFPYEHAPHEVATALQASGMQNVLFNLSPGDWSKGERGLAGLPGREAEFRDSVATAIAYAQALGTQRLHAMSGIRAEGVTHEDYVATVVPNLRYACDQLAPHGITLLIEPINTRDMPGYLLSLQADAHDLLARVGRPNLKVQMDFYHVQIMEGDVATKFRHWQKDIGHIQIASVPARHEPDEGELNYRWLFKLLDELGYDGWVGCEYRPRAGTLDGLAWMR